MTRPAAGSIGRRRALGALAAAAAAGTAAAADPPGVERRPWPRGQPVPPLDLPTLDGTARWRLADARGRVVVLNFWATWCEPCRAELPSLELLAARHQNDRFDVMAVNFREGEGTIRRFLERQPLTLPVLRDGDGAAARAWQVRVFPSTVLIGRDGRPAFTAIGELDWTGAAARSWIAPLL